MSNFINTVDVIGDDALTDKIIEKTLTEYKDNRILHVGEYAFCGNKQLTDVDLPSATYVGGNAFLDCSSIIELTLPMVETSSGYIVANCTSLKRLILPKIRVLAGFSCDGCSSLELVDLGAATEMSARFYSSPNLSAMILRNSTTPCVLSASSNMGGSAIANGNGYIYVPRVFLSDTDSTKDYRRMTNWSAYSDQFKIIEDHTVDGTITGSFYWCSGVTLDHTSLTFKDYNPQTLTATMLNPSPYGFDFVEWKSEDPNIAGVSDDGVVRPHRQGMTSIIAVSNGHTAKCNIIVENLDGINIMQGTEFSIGYISGTNGTIYSNSQADRYTSQFPIAQLSNLDITINLLGVTSSPNNSRIVYYRENGTFVGCTNGSTSNENAVVITSTVPSDAMLAAISVAIGSGEFDGIEIICNNNVVGVIYY